jgi:hypothetical protein
VAVRRSATVSAEGSGGHVEGGGGGGGGGGGVEEEGGAAGRDGRGGGGRGGAGAGRGGGGVEGGGGGGGGGGGRVERSEVSLLVRVVDDFLYMSADLRLAPAFVPSMAAGHGRGSICMYTYINFFVFQVGASVCAEYGSGSRRLWSRG